jgi:hypothetical protein
MALSPRANYTDCATATCRRNSVPTFVDRGVWRGQRGGSPTVVNLSFLDRKSNYFHYITEHKFTLLCKVDKDYANLKMTFSVNIRLLRHWISLHKQIL